MSHFTALAAIQPGKDIADALQAQTIEQLVKPLVDSLMEPYQEHSENPNYLKFVNIEPEYRAKYLTDTADAFQMPDGRIIGIGDTEFRDHYEYLHGKVYEKVSGSLCCEQSEAARTITLLPDYPLRKLYPTPELYMEDFCGYKYDEANQAYGYYTNPDGHWYRYEIGGGWPFRFLVNQGCQTALASERTSGGLQKPAAPDGYYWVAGAMKCDIQWQMMKELRIEQKTSEFHHYVQWFQSGAIPHGGEGFPIITEDGISNWDSMAYIKGETLEQHLARAGLLESDRFPCSIFAYVNDQGWKCSRDVGLIGFDGSAARKWHEMIQRFIADLSDDTMLISLDCNI